jgi:hypothetical protein
MKIICAWCGKSMGNKEGSEEKIGHGMCPACAEKFRAETAKLTDQKQTTKRKEKFHD